MKKFYILRDIIRRFYGIEVYLDKTSSIVQQFKDPDQKVFYSQQQIFKVRTQLIANLIQYFRTKDLQNVILNLMLLILVESGARPSAVCGIKSAQISQLTMNFNLYASDTKTKSVPNDDRVTRILHHFQKEFMKMVRPKYHNRVIFRVSNLVKERDYGYSEFKGNEQEQDELMEFNQNGDYVDQNDYDKQDNHDR